jgi:hypothetical protein
MGHVTIHEDASALKGWRAEYSSDLDRDTANALAALAGRGERWTGAAGQSV